MMFGKGDVVSFGRPNGEKTEGIVVKVNGKTLLIETTEARGTLRVREAGKKWRVPNDSRFVTMVTPAAKRVEANRRSLLSHDIHGNEFASQDINENAYAAEVEAQYYGR